MDALLPRTETCDLDSLPSSPGSPASSRLVYRARLLVQGKEPRGEPSMEAASAKRATSCFQNQLSFPISLFLTCYLFIYLRGGRGKLKKHLRFLPLFLTSPPGNIQF